MRAGYQDRKDTYRLYDMSGEEDANGRIVGQHVSTGVGRPRFWERARYYGEASRLAGALDMLETKAVA